MSTISLESPLVLGSASPRRRDLIAGLRIPFVVLPADVSEAQEPGEPHERYLGRVVRDKLEAVMGRLSAEPREHAAVLVADTIVLLDGQVLGKPVDEQDAEALVSRLAGRVHVVHTRYALARQGEPVPLMERTVASEVRMRTATAREIRRYAETGEGLDKAGAYAVQGIGSFLVESIHGSWTNVVGLPVCELVSDLLGTRLLQAFP